MRPTRNGGHDLIRLILPLLWLVKASAALNATDFASVLAASASSARSADITGETQQFGPLSLTILTNSSHALIAFNFNASAGTSDSELSSPGWLAVGFGRAMSDSSMLILYPKHAPSVEWTISPRVAHGHNMPFVTNPSTDTSSLVFLEGVSASTAEDLTVSFLRPLMFGDGQRSLWSEGGRWVDWSARQGDAKVVWAWGESPPSGDSLTERIGMHGFDAFGSTSFNLSAPLFTPTIIEQPSLLNAHSLIILHAVLASATWLVMAPLGVLLHRLGRSGFPPLLGWHGRLQKYWTLPVTCAAFALGMMGSPHGLLHLGMHKAMGVMLVVMLIAQVWIAASAQAKSNGALPGGAGRGSAGDWKERYMRGMHVMMGAMLIGMGYMQLFNGWRKLTHHHHHEGVPDSEDEEEDDGVDATKIVLIALSLALGALFPILYFLTPRLLEWLPGGARQYRSEPLGAGDTTVDEEEGEEGQRAIPLLEGREGGFLSEEAGEFDLGTDSDSDERSESGDGKEKGRAWRRP